jgi:hypothetical protein
MMSAGVLHSGEGAPAPTPAEEGADANGQDEEVIHTVGTPACYGAKLYI